MHYRIIAMNVHATMAKVVIVRLTMDGDILNTDRFGVL